MDKRRLTITGPTAKRRRPDTSSKDATKSHSLTNDAFTVGWICALEVELAPSIAVLDEEFPDLPQVPGDSNTYTLGRIGEHNVVLACLPAGTTGTNAAATAATNMMRSFQNIRFTLMVGVGGGAPDVPSNDSRNDIRLGDVVVSCPTADSSGVLQYDFGKTMTESKFIRTNTLNKTSIALRTGISKLRARHRMEESQVPLHIATMLESKDKMREEFNHPGQEHDQLFRSDYDHIEGESNCEMCHRDALLVRKPRADKNPVIHYGLIGSANQVMKHGITRERLRKERGILCFEMEAAGLMDSLPCLTIRGICDYADSHKNKRWQPYAAAAAAAYAKEILSVIPAADVSQVSATDADTIHDLLRTFISESSLEQLLPLLPVLEQSQRKSAIPSLDPEDPEFSWVFRNVDYVSWRSNNSHLVLCLSSPLAHHLSQISSYLVDQEERAKRPVLYCFCSQGTNGEFGQGDQDVKSQNIEHASALIYTLLEQVTHFSPIEKRILIIRYFLNEVLRRIFMRNISQSWKHNGFHDKDLPSGLGYLLASTTVTEDILAVFQLTLHYAKPQPAFIVFDGIEMGYQGGPFLHLIGVLINAFRRQSSNMKALIAGPTLCDITALSRESVFIEHDKERKECLSSLQFENTRYGKISPEHRGSFDWIWTHDEYKSWSISETSRLLYVQGKPGSGKSTLTKYFDSNLQTKEAAAKQAIVAKFFYSFREGELQRSHYNMLLSLLYDILYQEEAFFYHHCQTEYRTHRCSGVKWDYTSLKRVLRSLQDYRSTSKRFYLIIDAVDESEESDRRNILNLLYDLCSNMEYCVVKIFIASRPVTQLEARRDEFLNFIRLQDETTHDISNFANSLLEGLDLTRAIAYMIDNAQGVFLWVKLVGEELLRFYEDGYSEHDIFTMLQQLPTELEELYALMLERMRDKKVCLSYGLKMLRFILFAQRPLRVDELLHSLGIPDDVESHSTFSISDESFEKRVPKSERIIISGGGNFLEIQPRNDGQRVVQVIHQTALEFFRDPHGVVSKSEFYIAEKYAHMCIATTCTRYLMVCAANTSLRAGLPDSERWIPNHYEYYAKYLDKRPLTIYAFRFLKYHTERWGERVNLDSVTQHPATQSTGDWINDPFSYLLESWVGSHVEPRVSKKIQNGLLIAAAKGGFDAVVEILVSAEVDVDAREESGRTALSWAAGNGQESTVRLLLEMHAAGELPDESGLTPLSWAARKGQQSTVRLLLTKNVSINHRDYPGRTALSWAAGNGHESTVMLLLEMHAAGELPDETGRTPLSWAAGNGQESTVRLLLETDVSINRQDYSGWTPLSWATANMHWGVTALLRENGATVSSWAPSFTAVKLLL
ncbi:putative kinesin [Trichoderma compactum]